MTVLNWTRALGTLMAAAVAVSMLSGCVRFGVVVGVGLPAPAAEEAPAEPSYSPSPPCAHPGDAANKMPPCKASNPEHAAYWNSRPDKFRIACVGQPQGYCLESTGMVPHCHGYGKSRFCHSHPGGAYTHNHLNDGEFSGKLALTE